MSCSHCRAWNEPRVALSATVIGNVFDFASSEADGKLSVTVSGGEPFIRGDLSQIIELITSYPVDQITITTNGSLSSEDRLEEIALSRKGVNTTIQVSIDSPDSVIHDKFRGFPGAFYKAVDAIKSVHRTELVATIRSTICTGKISSMESLVQLAQSLMVSSIGFGTVVPFGKAIDNSMGMSPCEKKEFLLEITRLKQKYVSSIEVLSEDPLKFALGCDSVWDYGGIEPDNDSAFGGCTAGINSFNVTSDGMITPCAVLPLKILDLTGKSVDQIKSAYAQSSVIKSLLSRSFGGKCGKCGLKRVCGGCRAVPFALKGDLLGSDDTCWL